MSVLEVSNISKSFDRTQVLKDISFTLEKGQVVSIIGSSGSGKTTLLRCLNFLERPDNGVIRVNNEVLFDANDPATHKESEIRKKRLHFGLVFQSFNLFPQYTALQNVMLAKELLAKELPDYKTRKKEIHAEIEAQAEMLLNQMGLSDRMKNYPHQLSGGMRQRVVIAIALSCNPDLLICDEPTTALDVTIQARILQLILNLQKKLGIAVIFITHNLGVVAKIADYVNVMYAGKVVETGKAEDIFFDPRHPYTWGLLSSMPDLTGDKKERLYTIPGNPPNLANEVKGDAFAVRNPYALNIDFEEEPPMFEINEHHQAATWLLHPDAPKVEMPQTLKKRIEQLRREEKRYAETEGAYGTDE